MKSDGLVVENQTFGCCAIRSGLQFGVQKIEPNGTKWIINGTCSCFFFPFVRNQMYELISIFNQQIAKMISKNVFSKWSFFFALIFGKGVSLKQCQNNITCTSKILSHTLFSIIWYQRILWPRHECDKNAHIFRVSKLEMNAQPKFSLHRKLNMLIKLLGNYSIWVNRNEFNVITTQQSVAGARLSNQMLDWMR